MFLITFLRQTLNQLFRLWSPLSLVCKTFEQFYLSQGKLFCTRHQDQHSSISRINEPGIPELEAWNLTVCIQIVECITIIRYWTCLSF